MAYDVRVIANLVLQVAGDVNVDVTNLSLNKIIYFLHVAYLHEKSEPLTTAKIEAWDYGPVFREIYHQFKSFGSNPITSKAKRLDVMRGQYVDIETFTSENDKLFLITHCKTLLKMSAAKLVGMSHLEDGAWHKARYGNGRVNPGIEITDELIMEAGIGKSRH
jgi:uncharacterized phage-associated protein